MNLENYNLLTGVVMLETMWKSRAQDLLDLISPFVLYASAKVSSPNEIIDKNNVLSIIKQEFGYTDMPMVVVEKVFKRNPQLFQRSYGEYKLIGNLDVIVEEIEKRRTDCETKINTISGQLMEYFEEHTNSHKRITIDEAAGYLQGFFSRYGIFVGTNQLEEHAEDYEWREYDYNIARYIFEKKDSHEIEYEYVIDLVKGYFLQSAIYIQAGNGNIISSTYRNVSFYYDTPFLLRLLGYKTSEDEKAAIELHKALEKQRGKFFYFPQTQHEVVGILNAYQRDLGHTSYFTLEGLDEKKYASADVERLKHTWENKLNYTFGAKLSERPEYSKRSDGTIDTQTIIDEDDLVGYMKEKIKWRSLDSLGADMESVIGIHKLRGSIISEEIEHCKALFVTTNSKLANEVNTYYKNNVNDKTFPLVITDSDLAALTWIKCGSTGDLPERQLLRNAFMATQPTPEILEKFSMVLDQMKSEGKLSYELAVAIKSSRYTKKELLFASFEGEDEINESLVEKIHSMLKEEYSLDARQDELRKANKKQSEIRQTQLSQARNKAREKALTKKEKSLKCSRRIVAGISALICIVAVIGLVISVKESKISNPVYYTSLIVSSIISAISVFDTVNGKKIMIDRILVNYANNLYEETYKEAYDEYISVINSEDM